MNAWLEMSVLKEKNRSHREMVINRLPSKEQPVMMVDPRPIIFFVAFLLHLLDRTPEILHGIALPCAEEFK